MKLRVERRRILIIPEGETDVAYIEEVLKLNKDGDVVECRRVNVHKLMGLAYLEVKEALNETDTRQKDN